MKNITFVYESADCDHLQAGFLDPVFCERKTREIETEVEVPFCMRKQEMPKNYHNIFLSFNAK